MTKKPFTELGLALRKRRKFLGLTQKQLADFSGCGEAFLHLLEHGKTTVRLDKVLDVMKVLGFQFRLETGQEGIAINE